MHAWRDLVMGSVVFIVPCSRVASQNASDDASPISHSLVA